VNPADVFSFRKMVVERQLGHPVIKAFNTIWFRSLDERG
jgi:hypothetical protein